MPSGPTIISAGELLVEFVSHRKGCGLEAVSEYSGPYPSGAPAIFIDQAARMGAATGFYGTVGDDGFGRSLVARLREDGVDTSGISTDPDRTTGTAFVSYYEDGSRTFIFHLKDTAAEAISFSAEDLPDGELILHVSAASLGTPKLRNVIVQAVEAVLARGGRISCDPNARPELMRDDAARQALQDIVEQSWCLMPSTSDLGYLFPGLDEAAAVEKMLSAKAEIIALKRGAEGATLISQGQRFDISPHKVEELDPTGAGDGFCGTFVGLLAQGVSLEEAGRRANAAGAIAVTRRGPMEGNSSPEEIDAFLAAENTRA
ncbi:carbohydrate kinase family protein [Aliiruegeria sabulilitoris]|uniref:carbohydrate kinase family protein n=1 Tax=Aliiruegeria sabulilitoris TaxID=1510458 RepID=UPI00082A4F0D|nr:sugar kinase [Aliiruegeria sabulilitoris]